MVAKKADDRYPSMTEVIADLEACRQLRDPSLSEKSTLAALHAASLTPTRTMPGRLVILCGTACILTVLGCSAFLDYEAAANEWIIPEETVTVKWYALLAGIGMVALGVLASTMAALVGWGVRRPGQRSSGPGEVVWLVTRWLLATIAGVIVGGLAGAAAGGALAVNESPEVRVAGSMVVGAFVGAALGRRRVGLVILGCTLAGYFTGTVVGQYPLSVHGPGLLIELSAKDAAMLGFGVVGAIVGAVLGAERREPAPVKSPPVEVEVKSPSTPRREPLGEDALGGGKTVRRVAHRDV
jgi:hypothetical protein